MTVLRRHVRTVARARTLWQLTRVTAQLATPESNVTSVSGSLSQLILDAVSLNCCLDTFFLCITSVIWDT